MNSFGTITDAITAFFMTDVMEEAFLRGTAGERTPCLHERPCKGQRTSKKILNLSDNPIAAAFLYTEVIRAVPMGQWKTSQTSDGGGRKG